jgi:hypothetical protein
MPKTASERWREAPFLLTVLAVLILVGYSAYAAYPYLRGPVLTLNAPSSHTDDTVISGRTVRVSTLTIDGLPIPLDEQGAFSVERAYPPGYTVVTVRAADRFGRAVERTLTFITSAYASQKIENGQGRVGTSSPPNTKTNGSH